MPEINNFIESMRARFPRGLTQPEGSYRFGLDALLLGAWGARAAALFRERRGGKAGKLLACELGCGCGGALLAFCLLEAGIKCLGIDREPDLLMAASLNAARLGLSERVEWLNWDLASGPAAPQWRACCFLVMANPPWRSENDSKSAKGLRRRALWGPAEILKTFCGRAAELLSHHGFFCSILPPGRLTDFCLACGNADLGLREILPLSARAGRDPGRLLVLCQKNAKPDAKLLFPLILYDQKNIPAKEALRFCPWLDKKRFEE